MSEHIDPLSASLSVTRDRQQLAPHVRAIEVQILDALLRIEELLTPGYSMSQFVNKEERAKALADLAENDADLLKFDVIKDVAPTKTPFMDSITGKKGRKGK